MFFVPLFTVSCQGHKFSFSAARLSTGYTYEGRQIVKPYIVCSLLFILPIVVFVASIIIKNSRLLGGIGSICGLINMILLIGIISKAKSEAEANYMNFNIGFGFYLSLILNLIFGCISLYALIGSGNNILVLQNIDVSDTVTRVCAQCGSLLKPKDIYCGECGTKYEETFNNYSQQRFCIKCGKELRTGDNFCTNCGSKVEKSV